MGSGFAAIDFSLEEKTELVRGGMEERREYVNGRGGSGLASYIQFKHIVMENVTNPILIDQNYCDKPKKPCPKQKSAVQISNVLYEDISGTSASDVAVRFDCSDSVPCQDIMLEDINLQRVEDGKDVEASCNNVQLSYYGDVNPSCCS
ncbi:Polygalacturonase [Stylosanthes scabra]|uniref:Polygalacturonase n=1 Tax=Stylosanthes scabra TaxID=79078 RepID=A0ABU6TRW5_9FABA|nr:Polygalacturonase [Stylosanthes scabra]